MNKLLPCPFCGAGETISSPDSKVWAGMEWRILSWHVRHWCHYTTHAPIISVRGKDQQEAEARWNNRTSTEMDALQTLVRQKDDQLAAAASHAQELRLRINEMSWQISPERMGR